MQDKNNNGEGGLQGSGANPSVKQVGNPEPTRNKSKAGFFSGLSLKLLVLTIVFVMIAEILIFIPSVANFRNVWLQSRIDTAEAASIVYLDLPDTMLSEDAERNILTVTNAYSVAIVEGGARWFMAQSELPGEINEHIPLSEATALSSIGSSLHLLVFGGDGIYRVMADMKAREGSIELVQSEQPIHDAMLVYARNIFFISLLISLITAGLVFLALYGLIVRPVQRITENMTAFAKEPEEASRIFRATDRADEIGIAERQLTDLQSELQQTLRQKQRLADLGLAVSKINHDLRNILASASLFSDRLADLPDPTVQRFAPKLIRTIDRAVEYTRSVITYGKALEAPPNRRTHYLRAIVNDVADLLGLEQDQTIEWENKVADDCIVRADSEQLFRVIMNIVRNAAQAMDAHAEPSSVNRLSVSSCTTNEAKEIRISDTGPGIGENQLPKLFKAFQGSGKTGGTGLGLAIARELTEAHGGMISVETTDSTGTCFLISLPHETGDNQKRIEGNDTSH